MISLSALRACTLPLVLLAPLISHAASAPAPAGQAPVAQEWPVPDVLEFAAVGEPGTGKLERKINPEAISIPGGFKISVYARELTYPTDITFAPTGEAYVSEAGGHFYGTDPAKAPPPRILQVMPDGKTKVIYDKVVPIEAIRNARTYKEIPEGLIGPIEGVTFNPRNGLIYVAHRTRVSTLNPKTGEFRTIIGGLPAWGIFHNTKVIFDPQGRMVFSVSSQGNAGPVDSAIMKVISFYNKPLAREIPCEDVTLTGVDYWVKSGFSKDKGQVKLTGAYVPYGVRTKPGQVLQGEFWCNSAMYRANADGTNAQRIAWGIRNAFHYEFSPDGRLIATNNSCNPIPGRPVYDDWETVYEIREGLWYGWPDYCSGVPITDRRFARPNDPQFKINTKPPQMLAHDFVLTPETHKRLLKAAPLPPQPLVKMPPHAGAQGFKFGRKEFGMDPNNEILLAEFGSVVPYEVTRENLAGFRISLVNLKTGKRIPFMVNANIQPASAAGGQPAPQGGGLERPIRLEYGPDGALYVVDFGVFDVSPKPKDKKTKTAYANTGVIWKVTRPGP